MIVARKIFEPSINEKELNDAVKEYHKKNEGQFPSFMVMNSTTNYQMWKQHLNTEDWNVRGASFSCYGNIPIAISEKLEDGVINII